MKEELEKKLNELAKSFPEDNRTPMQKAIQGPLWKKDSTGKECLDLISRIPEYKMFDNHLQYLGNGGVNITKEQLLDWLLDRAKVVGSQQSVSELDFYISKSVVKADLIELVIGTHSDCEYEFSNGVKYTGLHNISNTSLAKDLVNESYGTRTPFPSVTGIFTTQFEHPVIHILNTDISRKNKNIEIPYDKLRDARLNLSLARPVRFGIHSIATTIVAADSLPFISVGNTWRIIQFKPPPLAPPILEIEFKAADKLLRNYESLESGFKNKLRIPLEKLNGFGSGESMVDRAIELRICLESIFLADGNKEQLRYRLALRAALFLGSSIEERQKIFKLIRDTYDMTSTVVHNGKFSKNDDTNLLYEAANLAKKAIIKLMENGQVNWVDLELRV